MRPRRVLLQPRPCRWNPKIVFIPRRLWFLHYLTPMTSQMAILVQRAMLKIKPNNFHNSIHIIECLQVPFYGNHVHVGGAKTDFDPPRLYFYTILTIMTSQMAISIQRAILKNESNFFHNSIHIPGCCHGEFYGHHVHVGRTKYDFHPPRLFFTLFWP